MLFYVLGTINDVFFLGFCGDSMSAVIHGFILRNYIGIISKQSLSPCNDCNRVATNLENLEYSGISLKWNSPEILCNLGEKL